ncbi:hypothetical protein MPSEU_000450700 [Mayamaea pseudoterrestris]|nr:hypothetical protein MPSEU_000450700 [Mayamaea pseudoterrestris]
MSPDNSAELVEEPKEVDVLCGRGGMSNHHPGNEWYRRLIRSNRPLYRACPKHTKLLVSKAIVQAVEQQGGRFLEKDKKSKLFVQVPYKRAVDKTSQGLRERDREDGSESDEESDEDEQQPQGARVKRQRMVVPEEFSGRNKNPNMSDLATVAIGMTNRVGGLSRRSGADVIKRPKLRIVVGKKSRSDLLADDDDEDDDHDENEQDEVKEEGRSTGEINTELPPPLHTSQTSTFRLLNQPNPLSHARSQSAGLAAATSPVFLPSFSQSFAFPQPPGVQSSVSQLFHPAVPGIYWVNPASPNPVSFLPVPISDSAPPPISRLTSQVSDWLTSFWPLGKETEQEIAGRQAAPRLESSGTLPTAIANQIKIPAPLDNDKPQISTIPPITKRIVHMQQRVQQKQHQAKSAAHKASTSASKKASASSSRPNPIVSQQDAQLEAWQRFQAQQAVIKQQYEQQDYNISALMNQSTGAMAAPAAQGKRKSPSPALPRLRKTESKTYRNKPSSSRQTSSALAFNHEDDDVLAAAPTELEQSVSATLLKLASSGRLESGITTFFERQGSLGGRMGKAHHNTDDRVSGTLLDDYEETEAERHMRRI